MLAVRQCYASSLARSDRQLYLSISATVLSSLDLSMRIVPKNAISMLSEHVLPRLRRFSIRKRDGMRTGHLIQVIEFDCSTESCQNCKATADQVDQAEQIVQKVNKRCDGIGRIEVEDLKRTLVCLS